MLPKKKKYKKNKKTLNKKQHYSTVTDNDQNIPGKHNLIYTDCIYIYIYGQNIARSPFSSFALMNMQIWTFPTEHAQNWADKMQLDSLAP